MAQNKYIYFYNNLVAVVATWCLLLGPCLSDGENYLQKSIFYQQLLQDNASNNKTLEEQVTGYNPDIKRDHIESAYTEQADEDYLVIEQAYTGYQEVLAKEQEVLSKQQDYGDQYEEPIEQMDSEIDSSIEAEENTNNLKLLNPETQPFAGMKDNTYDKYDTALEESSTNVDLQCGYLHDHRDSKDHPRNSPKGRPRNSPNRPRSLPKGHPRTLPKSRPRSSPKSHPRNSPKSGPRRTLKSKPKNGFQRFPKSCSNFIYKFLKIKNRGQLHSKNGLIKFVTSRTRDISLQDFVSISGFNSLLIKSIRLDCSTHILTITVKAKREWVIIPDYMSLRDLSGLLTVKITSPQNTLQASLRGYWRVGNLNVLTKAKYSAASQITHIVVEPKSRTSLKSFVKSVTSLNLPISSSIKVHFKFEGSMYPKGAVFLLLSSKQSDNWFYALFKKKNKKSQAVKAIAVEVKRFRLSTLVKRLVKLDFSQTPFFGKLIVPDTGLIYSTAPMKIAGRKVFKNSPLLQTTKNVISKGLSVYFRVPFHPDPLIAKYKNRVLVVTTPRRNLRLDKLLHYVLSGRARSITLPIPQLKRILRMYIETVTIRQNSVTVEVSFPHPVVFFKNYLKLSNVKSTIQIQNKKPRVAVKVSGKIYIAGTTFKTELYRNRRRKYALKAIGDQIKITKLMQQLHAALLPGELNAIFRRLPFVHITILAPKIYYTFGARPMQMHIGGIPKLSGYRIANIDVLMVNIHGKVKAILGLELGYVNLAKVLTKVTGFNFRRFLILNQNIKTSITISPITLNRVHFAGKLASLPINQGISLKASMKFPRHCGSDKFCKFAGKLIGHNAVLGLRATIRSATYYSVTAAVHNIRLGNRFTFYKAGLEIIGGTSTRIGLVGELKVNKPNLVFAARISVGTKGLTLQLSMKNCWYRAFGADWLDLCNLLGAIDFVPPGITGFAIGAQVHLGYRSTRHQLRAKAYVGISANPIENFYYARFNRVTMHSLLRAFKVNVHIPRPLGNSGFPRGFLASFSLTGKYLPEVRLSIPRGYRIKGLIQILGLRGHADITIGLPKLLDINVALPPLRIGNIFAMYASSRERHRGPFLKAYLNLYRRKVKVSARGYLHVLGTSFSTHLQISNSHYSLSFRRKLFHLFWASVHMTATYRNIRHAHFHIRGSFEGGLFHRIQKNAFGLVVRVGRAARHVYNHAVRHLRHLQHLQQAATHTVNRFRHQANRFRNEINRWRRKIFGRVMEISDNDKEKDVATISWGRVGRFIRRPVKIIRRVIRRPIHLFKRSLNRAKGLHRNALNHYHRARNHFNHMRRRVHQASNHLNRLRHGKGMKMFNAFTRYGLGGLIRIERITFSVSLGRASSGHFDCGVIVQFLRRHRRHFRAGINLRHLSHMGKHLFNILKGLL